MDSLGDCVIPNLMWLRDIKRQKLPELKNIAQITRSNVVCHVSPTMSSKGKCRRLRLGVLVDRFEDKVDTTGETLIKRASNTNPNNPFAHLLLDATGYPGKLLAFDKGNMIRNGKYSQPEHLALVYRFLIFTNRPWYAGIAVPNNVISAVFKNPVGIEIKNDQRASWSAKFPGISIISPRKGRTSKCTPIIYVAYNSKEKVQRRSSVNFAGPRTAEDFIYHLKLVDELSLKYPSKNELTIRKRKRATDDDDDESDLLGQY